MVTLTQKPQQLQGTLEVQGTMEMEEEAIQMWRAQVNPPLTLILAVEVRNGIMFDFYHI